MLYFYNITCVLSVLLFLVFVSFVPFSFHFSVFFYSFLILLCYVRIALTNKKEEKNLKKTTDNF